MRVYWLIYLIYGSKEIDFSVLEVFFFNVRIFFLCEFKYNGARGFQTGYNKHKAEITCKNIIKIKLLDTASNKWVNWDRNSATKSSFF